MRQMRILLYGAGLLFATSLSTQATANSLPSTVRFTAVKGDIRGDGMIDWNDFSPPLPAQVPVHGLGGISAMVTQQRTFGMGRITQDPLSPSMGGLWGGSFAPGETLLWTGFGSNGPMTLTFSTPVAQAGMQIQGIWTGTFVAALIAFDSQGGLLGNFRQSGLSADTADDSAPFIGVVSTQANISKLIIDIEPYRNFGHCFAIDGPIISLVPIPEPSGVLPSLMTTVCLLSLRRPPRIRPALTLAEALVVIAAAHRSRGSQ